MDIIKRLVVESSQLILVDISYLLLVDINQFLEMEVEWKCHMSHVACHVSHVTCHMSHVTCHVLCVTCLFFLDKVVKLIAGGSIINGSYPV